MAQIPLDMKATILKTTIGLGAVGLFGAFAAHGDIVAVGAAWGHMFAKLAKQAGRRLDSDRALKIASGVLVGASSFLGGMKIANTYLAYTGVGTIPAAAINSGTNGLLTWLVGRGWAQIVLEDDLEQSVDNLVRSLLGALGGALPSAS